MTLRRENLGYSVASPKDGWRTNKPSLLRLLLTGNHGRTDRLRRQADPIESQAQHRQGDRFVRTVRYDKKLHIHNAHLAPLKPLAGTTGLPAQLLSKSKGRAETVRRKGAAIALDTP